MAETEQSNWWIVLDVHGRAIRIHEERPEEVAPDAVVRSVRPETPEERATAIERWFAIVDAEGRPTQVFTPTDEHASVQVPPTLTLTTVRAT